MQVDQTYMNKLYEAEAAAKAFNRIQAKAMVVREHFECESKLLDAQSAKKRSVPLFFLALGLTILLLVGSSKSINDAVVLRNICRILFVISALTTVSNFFECFASPVRLREAENALVQAERALAEYKQMEKKYYSEHHQGNMYLSTMMPRECYTPAYARKYISFFETGMATTEREARMLFEEFMHRERMEAYAAQQVGAIQAGNAEIIAAANRAADAADSAARAARSIDRDTTYMRSK